MKRFGKWWAKRAGRNFIKRLSNGFNNPHHREVLKKMRKGGISRVARDPVRRIENLQFRKGWFLISPKSVFVKFPAFQFLSSREWWWRGRGWNEVLTIWLDLKDNCLKAMFPAHNFHCNTRPGLHQRRLRLNISFNLTSNRRLKKTQSSISRASCLITHPNRTEKFILARSSPTRSPEDEE